MIVIFLNPRNNYFDPDGLVDLASLDDIAAYLGAVQIESISTASRFGYLDFWFHPIGQASRDVNRPATELLLAATPSTAKNVPFLRGRIVVSSHDESGGPTSLTREQITKMALHKNRVLDQWLLDLRYVVDARSLRRRLKAERAAASRAAWNNLSNALRP